MEYREQLEKCNTHNVPPFSLSGSCTIGKIVEMYDGDTCKIAIPLFEQIYKFNCRLTGIDTPEMKPKSNSSNRDEEINAAHRARNFLLNLSTNCDEIDLSLHLKKTECEQLLQKNTKIISVVCGEFDKYGRLLVELYDENAEPDAISYNQRLITGGYAKSYSGGTKEAF